MVNQKPLFLFIKRTQQRAQDRALAKSLLPVPSILCSISHVCASHATTSSTKREPRAERGDHEAGEAPHRAFGCSRSVQSLRANTQRAGEVREGRGVLPHGARKGHQQRRTHCTACSQHHDLEERVRRGRQDAQSGH